MRKRSLKLMLLIGLLSLTGSRVAEQDTPVPPPSGEPTRTPEQIEKESQAFILDVIKGMDNELPRLNPAFRPLFPLYYEIRVEELTGNSKIKLWFPKDLFDSPLKDMKTFLAQQRIKEVISTTENWLAHFRGPDPNFKKPLDGDETSGASILSALAESLEVGWGAEERLHFADGRINRALDQLGVRLRIVKLMQNEVDSLYNQYNQFTKGSLNYLSTYYAHQLSAFTPHQCARLLQIIEHWQVKPKVSDKALLEAMHEDQESQVQEVLNDGTLVNHEGGQVKNWAEDDPDLARTSAIPPTSEALEKRKQIVDAIAEDYGRIRFLLKDLFAPLPPEPVRPKWLDQIVGGSCEGFLTNELIENRQITVRLKLLEAHIALRQFRWEHDRLPRTLAELQNPKRMTDPVTHALFNYTTDGKTYTLKSAGVAGIESDEKGNDLPTRPYDLLKEELENPWLIIVYNSASGEGTSPADTEPSKEPVKTGE